MMKREKIIHVVIPHTTEHSIIGRLQRHFDEIKLYALSESCYINPSSQKQIQKFLEEIADAVKKLPELQDGFNYHLLLTGFPYAGIAAYELLTTRFDSVSILIFDSKRKEYVSIPNAPLQMREIWEKTQKETKGGE